MRVFVTGATGVLGHRLVERLVDRGHAVVGLVRDEAGAETVSARGGVPRHGDVLERSSLETAIDDDVDAVVHAATAIPVEEPTEDDWRLNDRVRLEGARNLVRVAGETIDQFYVPSVVWVARQPDGSPFDEASSRHPDRSTRSVAAVEDLLAEAGDRDGFDVAVLRCGFFYAPDAGHTRWMGRSLLEGDLPVLGSGVLGRGDARLSLVHADDAALAFADALDAGVTGRYHVVDERPVTAAAFLQSFADRLDAPAPGRVPAWLARLFTDSASVDLLSRPMPTSNDRFCEATGWEPRYPTYRDGLEQVAETWENDGTLRTTATGYEWAGEPTSGT